MNYSPLFWVKKAGGEQVVMFAFLKNWSLSRPTGRQKNSRIFLSSLTRFGFGNSQPATVYTEGYCFPRPRH
jgi:hypothetical protein